MRVIRILKRYYKFFKKYKSIFLVLIMATIIGSVTQFLTPLYMGKIIDAVSLKLTDSIYKYGYTIIIFFIITMIFSIIETYISSYLQINIKTTIETYLFNRIVNSKIEILDRVKGAELINRLEEDTNTIASFYITNLSNYIIEIIKLVISTIIIFIISIQMTSIALMLVPLNFISALFLSKKIKNVRKKNLEINDKNRIFIQEIISGIREVKNLVIENKVIEEFSDNLNKCKKLNLKNTIVTTVSNSINLSASFIINLILIFYAGWLIINNNLTLGDFVAFNSYLAYFLGSIKTIWAIPMDIQSLIVSDERIGEILEYKIEEEPIYKQDEIIDGDIIFNNIDFKYSNSDLILKNLNIKIKDKSLTAIVGENGAGKTTIFNLLNRFYTEYYGSILIGNKLVEEIDIKTLRKNITYIQQTAFLFNKSIKDNLKLGEKDIDDNEIILACKKVNIHEFINTLPDKYDTIIENNGNLLSGGQKQKIAIARGIIRNTSIFLLDEVTKGLDAESSEKLINIIKELSRDHTIIMISHDKNIYKIADKIILINNGMVGNY